jgi:hypothetical protein
MHSLSSRYLCLTLLLLGLMGLALLMSLPLTDSAQPLALTDKLAESKQAILSDAGTVNIPQTEQVQRAGFDSLALLKEKLLNSEDIRAALVELDASQMEAAAALAARFGMFEPEGQKYSKALMQRWGELDANAALRYALSIGGEWAGPAALEVLRTAPEFDSAWLNHAHRFSRNDAAAYLAELWEGLDETSSATWADWVNALPFGTTKDAATEALVGRWASTDPSLAADWLREQDPTGINEHAYLRLAHKWADRDARAALQWAESLTNNEGQAFAQKASTSTWSGRSPAEAYRYIAAMSRWRIAKPITTASPGFRSTAMRPHPGAVHPSVAPCATAPPTTAAP